MNTKKLPYLSTSFIVLVSIGTALFASFVPDWRHQFATAGYYNYTSLTWLQLLLNNNKSKPLLETNFDQLSENSPEKISPLKYTHPVGEKLSEYTTMQVSTNSHSGSYSINLIPNGNPSTTESGILSSAIIDNQFNVSAYRAVKLSFWGNSTSNPRIDSVNNCDSSLDIRYRIDGETWQNFSSFCGQHKSETSGWQHFDLSDSPIITENANTIEFALEYYIQNSNGDASVYYLIDDFTIMGIE